MGRLLPQCYSSVKLELGKLAQQWIRPYCSVMPQLAYMTQLMENTAFYYSLRQRACKEVEDQQITELLAT